MIHEVSKRPAVLDPRLTCVGDGVKLFLWHYAAFQSDGCEHIKWGGCNKTRHLQHVQEADAFIQSGLEYKKICAHFLCVLSHFFVQLTVEKDDKEVE